MGVLVVTEHLSLDGVGQAPGGPDEDPDGGFALGGWQAPFVDAASGAAMREHARGMDAMLLGRRTYELFAGYWPHQGADNPFAALMNGTPRYVASRTLREPLSWAGARLLDGDLAATVAALKERHDVVNVVGSLGLVRSLLRGRLVDRLHLWVHPLVLGSGKRVLGDGAVPARLRLVRSHADALGNLELVYDVTDEPVTGGRVDATVVPSD